MHPSLVTQHLALFISFIGRIPDISGRISGYQNGRISGLFNQRPETFLLKKTLIISSLFEEPK